MGARFCERVAEIHDQCRVLVKTEFNDIFVSEQLVQGRRTYVAIHFFTDYHVLRCKNFIETFAVEMRHLERISSCDFANRDFDLKTVDRNGKVCIPGKSEVGANSFHFNFGQRGPTAVAYSRLSISISSQK